MLSFFKRLFCYHYWNKGTPVVSDEAFGLYTFTCLKCEKQKKKIWNWGARRNQRHRIE